MRITGKLPQKPSEWGRVLAAVCVLVFSWTVPVTRAQTGSTAASIAFTDPTTRCSFSGPSNLSLGTFEVPRSGTLSVTVSALTGSLSTNPSGHRVSGASVGTVTLSGSNVTSYSVTQSPSSLPTRLTSTSNSAHTITFAALKARSTNGTSWGSTSTSGPGQFDTGSGSGLFSSFTRYFRLGGTVSSIRPTTPPATYSATITLTFSCS